MTQVSRYGHMLKVEIRGTRMRVAAQYRSTGAVLDDTIQSAMLDAGAAEGRQDHARRRRHQNFPSTLFVTVPLRTIPRSHEGPNGWPFRARTPLAAGTRESARSESPRALSTKTREKTACSVRLMSRRSPEARRKP